MCLRVHDDIPDSFTNSALRKDLFLRVVDTRNENTSNAVITRGEPKIITGRKAHYRLVRIIAVLLALLVICPQDYMPDQLTSSTILILMVGRVLLVICCNIARNQ